MTLATAAAFAPAAPSLRSSMISLRDTLAQRAARRRACRATLADLDALSERDLSGLGLARAAITRVALEASQA